MVGHPLAGWRYWRVYSVGTNDVVIETGAYGQPAPNASYGGIRGIANYAGYYISRPVQVKGWEDLLNYIKLKLPDARQGPSINSLGGIRLRTYPWPNGPLLKGYFDYFGDFTRYILNNVCQSTVCN
jgi:hypothetical protein